MEGDILIIIPLAKTTGMMKTRKFDLAIRL